MNFTVRTISFILVRLSRNRLLGTTSVPFIIKQFRVWKESTMWHTNLCSSLQMSELIATWTYTRSRAFFAGIILFPTGNLRNFFRSSFIHSSFIRWRWIFFQLKKFLKFFLDIRWIIFFWTNYDRSFNKFAEHFFSQNTPDFESWSWIFFR